MSLIDLEKKVNGLEEAIKLIADWVKFDYARFRVKGEETVTVAISNKLSENEGTKCNKNRKQTVPEEPNTKNENVKIISYKSLVPLRKRKCDPKRKSPSQTQHSGALTTSLKNRRNYEHQAEKQNHPEINSSKQCSMKKSSEYDTSSTQQNNSTILLDNDVDFSDSPGHNNSPFNNVIDSEEIFRSSNGATNTNHDMLNPFVKLDKAAVSKYKKSVPQHPVKKHVYTSKSRKCVTCGQVFEQHEELKEHRENVHNERTRAAKGKGLRQCPHCEKKIYKRSMLLIHIRRCHTRERPFLCSECGYASICSTGLASHTEIMHRKNKDEKNFVCKYCAKTFGSNSTLNTHEKIHEGAFEKSCPHCNRKYANLSTHIKTVHEKLRPYKCPHCEHKFKRNCHLVRHVATHNNPNRRVKGYHIERPDKPPKLGKKLVMRMFEPTEVTPV